MAAELEAQLETPPFPQAVEYLWRAWLRLRRRQAPGMAGPSPIGWVDFEAFCRLTGQRFHPWEVSILEALDDTYLKVTASEERDPAAIKQGLKDAGKQRD